MASLKESLNKGITTLNVKTNNFMEESKCRTYITTLENEIKDLKQVIGENVYAKWSSGLDLTDGLEELFQKIKEKQDEIEAQRAKINMLQEQEKQILGTTQTQAPAPADGTFVFCSQCGAQNASNYKFCCKCGKPLQE